MHPRPSSAVDNGPCHVSRVSRGIAPDSARDSQTTATETIASRKHKVANSAPERAPGRRCPCAFSFPPFFLLLGAFELRGRRTTQRLHRVHPVGASSPAPAAAPLSPPRRAAVALARHCFRLTLRISVRTAWGSSPAFSGALHSPLMPALLLLHSAFARDLGRACRRPPGWRRTV